MEETRGGEEEVRMVERLSRVVWVGWMKKEAGNSMLNLHCLVCCWCGVGWGGGKLFAKEKKERNK